MNNFGLKSEDILYIVNVLSAYREVEKALIFGSRAMGNTKKGSDVDIAIFGQGIDFRLTAHIHSILEDESPMPYFFDIVDFKNIENQELKNHITEFGKEIYSRDSQG